jgi:hypothetical protein
VRGEERRGEGEESGPHVDQSLELIQLHRDHHNRSQDIRHHHYAG